MITLDLAQQLKAAGLRWDPIPGDQFAIPQPDLADAVFTLSDMTIEAHVYPSGVILGFNGTTEWALDSVDVGETVWLPREDQLRDLIGARFVSLQRQQGTFVVTVRDALGEERLHRHSDAGCAYGEALISLLREG